MNNVIMQVVESRWRERASRIEEGLWRVIRHWSLFDPGSGATIIDLSRAERITKIGDDGSMEHWLKAPGREAVLYMREGEELIDVAIPDWVSRRD